MSLRNRILAQQRMVKLRECLKQNGFCRVMEVHNGLSAILANNSSVTQTNGITSQFDALWISSLTDSAAKGHPDIGVIDFSSRLETLFQILQVTDKPIIVDGDTGGDENQFEYFCSKLELLGVSAVIIEDKQFPKRNSLEDGTIQILEDPHQFARKINRAKAVLMSDTFMIIARIESFIADQSLADALMRAEIYLLSDADGIMIHSKEKTPAQIYAFSEKYQALCAKLNIYKPLVCVPTTYNEIYEDELLSQGFSIVIYANHLLRAAHKSMRQTCESILQNKRSFEASPYLASTKEIFEAVGFLDVKEKDDQFKEIMLPVVLLCAGVPSGFQGTAHHHLPICEIPIEDTTLLSKQLSALKTVGLTDVTLVTGYQQDNISAHSLKTIYNSQFSSTKSLFSLFLAQHKFDRGFIMIFGDIIFDQFVIENLLNAPQDILLLIDPHISMNRKSDEKKLDLVVSSTGRSPKFRKLYQGAQGIIDIGPNIALTDATHEFIGIAKFSAQGSETLRSSYTNMCHQISHVSNKQEIIAEFDFSDLIRHMIHNKVCVEGLEVRQGWAELHNMQDLQNIERLLA